MQSRNPVPEFPERIEGLRPLAYNLWWSWHRPAAHLFQMLDPHAWRESDHNPIHALAMLPEGTLDEAALNEEYLEQYDAVMEQFRRAEEAEDGWFRSEFGAVERPLAYFSAEYGLHSSLPVYAGGLGILAGDYLKECSDLDIPLVAVGMIYSQGYVHQRIREDGWQEDVEEDLDRTYNPISRVMDEDGKPLTVRVPALDPAVHVGLWEVRVGRIRLYLLDPDLDMNRPWDRKIASSLYVSDPEQRLRQEVLLGMGGMRALDAIGIEPAGLHLNEGHSFLAVLERARSYVDEGTGFEEALDQVRDTTVFTTHTPVPAGSDIFPFPLMDKYLSGYLSELDADRDNFFELGTNPDDPQAGFNTTVFALRTSHFRNGVSQRHGEVARGMWQHLWPDRDLREVPIKSITNGVHLPSWIDATRMQPLLDEHLGSEWIENQDDDETWGGVEAIPDEVLWEVHQRLKGDMLAEIDARARQNWHEDQMPAENIIAFGALLDPEALTFGFARRVTDYKRLDLILNDMERFKGLVTNPLRPVQVIFAGEAHPADVGGKRLIKRVFRVAQDPAFAGRIAFVEDYDQELAGYMVHGVDVWLNNPIPPLEASGTSGIKASVNGIPNLSILDGWWIEGYDGNNGWAFGDETEDAADEETRGRRHAEALYRILEQEVIPRYYERSHNGAPHRFVEVMKRAIVTVAPHFGTRRMAKEYVTRLYAPVLGLSA